MYDREWTIIGLNNLFKYKDDPIKLLEETPLPLSDTVKIVYNSIVNNKYEYIIMYGQGISKFCKKGFNIF